MLAIVDERIPQPAADGLCARGWELVKLPPHPALPTPVSSHPDMLLFFAPDAIYTTGSYLQIALPMLNQIAAAVGKPIRTVAGEVGGQYPSDILLNAAHVGKYLFCREAHTAAEILDCGYCPADVRQGYAKCSTLPIGDTALITADPSIANAARMRGLDVLQIAPGNVTLPGYDVGLIGGAASCSLYRHTDEILFCGNPDLHPDADAIRGFCSRHGVCPVSLSSEPLYDVGTIFLI